MGVTGLWRLVEPAGKPVPVETLENKVLAVDISIWLHQMVKGYQDAKGAPLPNAHLMGLFQRLCKLLYFRVKPIFVFDGGFPDLKKETIAKRQDHKAKYNSESERLKRELALLLSKKTAVSSLLGKQISPKKSHINDADRDDIFKLPTIPQLDEESESDSEAETSSGSIVDLHSIDVQSNEFKSLPVKEKYDLLIELKETRKMNSWGRLHELPKKSDNFSDFQMQRLLKRRKVQECLEETEKEMGDSGMSLNDLESLLNEEGIDTKIESLPTRRIASNNNTRFLLIKNVKEAIAEAKRREQAENEPGPSTEEEKLNNEDKPMKKNELEEDIERAIKLSLNGENEADVSAATSKTDDSWTSLDNSDSEGDLFEPPDNMSSAKAYIMQYTDLTEKAIQNIVTKNTRPKTKSSKTPSANQIIDELKKETYIAGNIDLSSSDDECVLVDSKNSNQEKVVDKNDVNLQSSMNQTQESVMFIENNEREVISLDSSTEDGHGVFEGITESEAKKSEVDNDFDEDLQRAIKMSLEFIKEPIQAKEPDSYSSDSNDDDFEEVTEEKPQKPVVEITLNVGEAPEDDIFADIFEDKSAFANQPMVKVFEKDKIDVTSVKLESTLNVASNIKVDDSFDKNIEKAIKMSLECVKDTTPCHVPDSNVLNSSDDDFEEVTDKKFQKPVLESTLNEGQKDKNSKEKVENTATKSDSLLSEVATTSTTKIEEPQSSQQRNVDKTDKLAENKEEAHIGHTSSKSIVDCVIALQETTESIGEPVKEKSVENNFKENPEEDKRSSPVKQREQITVEQLNTMADELQTEEQNLLSEKGRLDRIGRNITEQMTKEAQELLQIFGIPYIVAPMEAEAQCAFLESVNLTDGTITDDSDIWLFGGKTVYKNFFNQKKHVLQFLAERIEKSFNLSREQLILLALLVGSDYTTGVTGVGPVTALEILASFPFNKKLFLNETSKQARYGHIIAGLQEFKKWVRAGRRTDNVTLKKKLKNVNLTEDFPSVRVVQAYLEPNVEKSEEKFTWGELDITVLRDYTRAKFGWSQNKLDEIIQPVLKRIADRKTQKSVQDYFKRKIAFQNLEDQMSKRVKAAVQKMGPEGAIEESVSNEVGTEKTKPAIKRKRVKNTDKREDLEVSGPSKSKKKKDTVEKELDKHNVKVVSQCMQDGKSGIEIIIPKTDRVQEIIPQREKEKKNLLQNKMKAIEIFRKTKLDPKKKTIKRSVNLPKEKAELSESDSD